MPGDENRDRSLYFKSNHRMVKTILDKQFFIDAGYKDAKATIAQGRIPGAAAVVIRKG